MTRLLLMLLLLASPAAAIPVVPSFSTGLVSSRTESKSVIKEKIISESYRTGFEYMVGGQGVKPSSGVVSPPASTNALSFPVAVTGFRKCQVRRFSSAKRIQDRG